MARDQIHQWSVQVAERWQDYRRRQPHAAGLPALKRTVRAWVLWARQMLAARQATDAPGVDMTPDATDHTDVRRRWRHQVRFLHAELLVLEGKRLDGVDVEQTEDAV